jgi:hypothetical protein
MAAASKRYARDVDSGLGVGPDLQVAQLVVGPTSPACSERSWLTPGSAATVEQHLAIPVRAGAELRPRLRYRLHRQARRAAAPLADVMGRVDPTARRDHHGPRRRPRTAAAPRVAPTQVVVLVARAGEGVVECGTRLVEHFVQAGIRAELDAHTDVSVGRRIIDWEMHGVPVRVALGPRDIASAKVPVALRARGVKTPHVLDGLADAMAAILAAEKAGLLRHATALRDRLTRPVGTIEEAAEQARDVAARVPWAALGPEGQRRLSEDGISVRCLVDEQTSPWTTPRATASTRSSHPPTDPRPSARDRFARGAHAAAAAPRASGELRRSPAREAAHAAGGARRTLGRLTTPAWPVRRR